MEELTYSNEESWIAKSIEIENSRVKIHESGGKEGKRTRENLSERKVGSIYRFESALPVGGGPGVEMPVSEVKHQI